MIIACHVLQAIASLGFKCKSFISLSTTSFCLPGPTCLSGSLSLQSNTCFSPNHCHPFLNLVHTVPGCTRHCTGWRQTTLESSVGLSARTMLAVLSVLRSAATSSSRELRQSSATEHSPSRVQSANNSQKFQHLVKLQICFEVSLVYLTILEAAPTVTICDGALESVLRVMAP